MITAAVAKRRYVLINILTWLPIGAQLAIAVLLMNARGLDVTDIGALFAVHGLAVAVLELPTGGLADVVGRRPVLLAGAGFALLGAVIGVFATVFWQFLIHVLLKALARALLSGPAEAWYVDIVHATDPSAPLRDGLAAGQCAGAAAIAGGAVLGGLVPLILPTTWFISPIVVPMSISVLLYGGLLVLSARLLVEPPRPRPRPSLSMILRDVPLTIARCAGLTRHDLVLTRVLLPAASIGVGLNAIELLSPNWFKDAAGGGPGADSAYGLASAVSFGAVAVGAACTRWAVRVVRPWVVAVSSIIVSGVSITAFSLVNGSSGFSALALALALYVMTYLAMGTVGPVRSELTHQRVSSAERASVVSIDSLLLQIGGGISGLVLPLVIHRWHLGAAWLVAGTVLALSSLFLVRIGQPSTQPPATAASAIRSSRSAATSASSTPSSSPSST